MWFIKVIESNLQSNGGDTDDYGHAIVKGANFHEEYSLERVSHTSKAEIYKILKKLHFSTQVL